MQICVVALGKIGLPLAVQFARKGHRVYGADVDARTVDVVNQGVPPFPNEAGLEEALAEVVTAGLLTATTDTTAAVADSDAVVVVVPLFVDSEAVPDFGWMDAATRAIGAGLRPGTLVSYETTLPVGTTRTRWAPMLAETSGLTPGEDFHLAFSPERVLTGRVFADLRKYPKLVGGIDEGSGWHAEEFYRAVLDFDERDDLPQPNGVWNLGSAEAAEMAKLAETTYRDVNIGLANQFARYADTVGVDVLKVIEACNSQPYSHIHRPGIAVGGHCIPIYPQIYLWNDPAATVVRAAREANTGMPHYAVDLLAAARGDLTDLSVLVLGAAYRGGVKEAAFSGVFPIVAELQRRGARSYVSDPLYTPEELEALGLPAHRGEPVEAAVIQADHREYATLSPEDLPGVTVLVDGRRVTDPLRWQGKTRLVIGG
ncbi:putative UDP-N-acetyl-D-mannosamine dehydrogenase [Microlunatus phosphovorus NM-1]|uniref:Putative UDP-N-acetyl-D-mannosamine dehydrogenase n=1 Tax=Microlunatus phosphovorus (strain ATCC 700054 / DSM 10555 / JCM 9379 / NBRC 101784 / NCIMB 13414 / VKM Ac-1990 / NM-1) TaxID=1032480 RepID=F5XGW1_MICPN|nr:nucleotide sugar dehydrogenase [Microlunatus phosphovorus]BAK35593.1 putative UDP-N-acetyl-D-mannosamine dehydrogenase [Microlunatus phosphovorus NM-1]